MNPPPKAMENANTKDLKEGEPIKKNQKVIWKTAY